MGKAAPGQTEHDSSTSLKTVIDDVTGTAFVKDEKSFVSSYTRRDMKLGAANVDFTRSYSAVLVHASALLSSFVTGLLLSGAFWTAILSWPTLNPRFGNLNQFAIATILVISLGLTLLFVYTTGKFASRPWTKHTRSLFFAGGFLGATAVIVFYVFVVVIFSISYFEYGQP